ncbi:hypothetical protein L6164_033736 [Bauhinia variegata]|uniref:Uncharacterized protein n=1 Tax=Bauhinia variegata TaxID=167791 RepID=A0ACB9KT09_BAUVA|nr:hypothetical protein L6164_033736 [Bauhinia variegata]
MEGQVLQELVVIKGRRTKRQRLPSPLRLAMASSTSAGRVSTDHSSTSSLDSTQEEEDMDMANCLILLAQGHSGKVSSSPEPANVAQPHNNYVYQCKTCNRCFPSFQALGGHRASHKKPKPNSTEEKQAVTFLVNEKDHDLYDHATATSTALSLQLSNGALYTSNNKPKVHDCSICGAEFSSGQALGGHMRRHRTFINTSTATTSSSEGKKPRNVLKLDLNLPAPEDDNLKRESKFPFQSKEKVLVFSASSLVDCHY